MKSGKMAYGSQILILTFLLQGLFSDGFVMPREDPMKLPDDLYDFCEKDSASCLGGYKNADKQCFEDKNCTTIIAFEKVDGAYVFQTFTHLSTGAAYVGLGLSTDQEMGNDGVVECIKDDKGETSVNVYLSYTSGKDSAIRLTQQKGVKPMVTKVDGDLLYCQFSLENSLDFENFKVSLEGNEGYYVFGVAGAVKKEGDNIIGVAGHRVSKMKSERTFFKTSGDDDSSTTPSGGDDDSSTTPGGNDGGSSIAACFSLVSILFFLTKFY